MIKNKCLVCGAYEFRADRALSGRLICISCGNPYGVRKVIRNQSGNNINYLIKNKLFFIFLIVLVIIFIVL
tara:strand:+ start:602 stop:814 length:213 start_codon:yes stop_codon:yes gene_type:complete